MGWNKRHTHRHTGSQRTSETSWLEAMHVKMSPSTVTVYTVLLTGTLEPVLFNYETALQCRT
jgi:hypothetical protein